MRDDFNSVVADRFTVLDDVPVPDTWSSIQAKVLGPTPTASVDVTPIALEAPTPTDAHRNGYKRLAAACLLAAAAVLAIALVAIRTDNPVNPADQASPTVSVPPPVPPQALFGTPGAQFQPGTYFVDEVDAAPTARILITIGDGWINKADWGIRNNDAGFISFNRPGQVYSDSCQWTDGFHVGPLTTLDGMVAVLSEQGGWVDVTPPTDASVDGYPGMTFQRTAPADFTDCGKPSPSFRGWNSADGTGLEMYYEANEIEILRVLDLNGTMIVVSGKLKPGHQDAAARAALTAVFDSIRIEPTADAVETVPQSPSTQPATR